MDDEYNPFSFFVQNNNDPIQLDTTGSEDVMITIDENDPFLWDDAHSGLWNDFEFFEETATVTREMMFHDRITPAGTTIDVLNDEYNRHKWVKDNDNVLAFPRSLKDVQYNQRTSRRTDDLSIDEIVEAQLWENIINLDERR